MVHDVAARQQARVLKKRARELAGEARALEGIDGAALLAGEKVAEAARLRQEAEDLQGQARLQDLTVREEALVKTSKKGRRMDAEAALQKARAMKAEALGI